MSHQNQPTKSGGPASGAANPHENGVAEGAKVLTDWLRGQPPEARPAVSDVADLLERGAGAIRLELGANGGDFASLRFSLMMLRLLCAAYSNTEIAEELFVSESTVKTHVSGIMTKMQVPSRLKAVVRAYELGLVEHS